MDERTLGEYLKSCADYYVKPGYLYVAEQATAMRTVLGSCVSVCIHDTRRKFGGINHYLLPTAPVQERTTRYGATAIVALLQTFLDFGSLQTDLVAQIVGGAGMSHHPDSQAIGRANVRLARQVLAEYAIPVRSQDVGGVLGRKVIYLSELDQLLVFKLDTIRTMDYFDYNDQRRLSYDKTD